MKRIKGRARFFAVVAVLLALCCGLMEVYSALYALTPDGKAEATAQVVTETAEAAATATEAAKPTSTPTLTNTPRPTRTPKPTRTPRSTRTPRPTQTPTLTVTPRPTQSPMPTATPRPLATATLRPLPTNTPAPVGPVCDCSADTRNCSGNNAFATHAEAQACFNYCMQTVGYDIHKLDGNNDGIACEDLP